MKSLLLVTGLSMAAISAASADDAAKRAFDEKFAIAVAAVECTVFAQSAKRSDAVHFGQQAIVNLISFVDSLRDQDKKIRITMEEIFFGPVAQISSTEFRAGAFYENFKAAALEKIRKKDLAGTMKKNAKALFSSANCALLFR